MEFFSCQDHVNNTGINEINYLNFYLGTVPGGRQRREAHGLRFCSTSVASLSRTRFHSDSASCCSRRPVSTCPPPVRREHPHQVDDFKCGKIPPEGAKAQLILPDAHFCFVASGAGVGPREREQQLRTPDTSASQEGAWGEDENPWNGAWNQHNYKINTTHVWLRADKEVRNHKAHGNKRNAAPSGYFGKKKKKPFFNLTSIQKQQSSV